jgi:hypothetical protein
MSDRNGRTTQATIAVNPELWDAYKLKSYSLGASPAALFEVWMKSVVDPNTIMHEVQEMQHSLVNKEVEKRLSGKKEK